MAEWWAFIGSEYPALEDCLRAGLHYERRETAQALAAARRAALATENGRSPEFYVCARAILNLILVSQGATGEARKLAGEVEEQLKERGAPFLWPNFRALTWSADLAHGRRETAEEWLALHAAGAGAGSGPLSFYKLPQHFTTARALLVTGAHHSAMLFLDRLRQMAESYRRPLDILETDALRAKALWSLGEMPGALDILAGALAEARAYGFVQVFLMAPLIPLLRILAFRDGQTPELRQFIARIMDLAEAKSEAIAPLSPQRRAILKHLEKQLDNQAIAADLNISPNTVKTHLKCIFRLLGVDSRQEAVKVARALNVI